MVTQGSASELQQTVDGLPEWSERNKMNINNLLDNKGVGARATKRIDSTTRLQLSGNYTCPAGRQVGYKLLGVTVNETLKFDDHIAAIASKATN